jgi:hypothetical protein
MNKFIHSLGTPVLYVCTEDERLNYNNGSNLAPAFIVRPWTGGVCNLHILTDSALVPLRTSVKHAENLERCLYGDCWISYEEAAMYGLDLNDPYLNIQKIIEARRAEMEAPSPKPNLDVRLSKEPFPESQATTEAPREIMGARPADADQLEPGD